MRYKPKSLAALNIALAGLPQHMRVEVEPGIDIAAKTVGELRKLTAWPGNLAITVPADHDPELPVQIGRPNVATRVLPKS
jgi:hypothetical protein